MVIAAIVVVVSVALVSVWAVRASPDALTEFVWDDDERPDNAVEAVRTYYAKWDLGFAYEEIFATTGGSEALLFSFGAIADPGDEVIVFEPFYTNYTGFAELIGVRTTPAPRS